MLVTSKTRRAWDKCISGGARRRARRRERRRSNRRSNKRRSNKRSSNKRSSRRHKEEGKQCKPTSNTIAFLSPIFYSPTFTRPLSSPPAAPPPLVAPPPPALLLSFSSTPFSATSRTVFESHDSQRHPMEKTGSTTTRARPRTISTPASSSTFCRCTLSLRSVWLLVDVSCSSFLLFVNKLGQS